MRTILDLQKGDRVKVKVPNVEKPIKATIIDIERFEENSIVGYTLLYLYAQKRLFKGKVNWYLDFIENEDTNDITDTIIEGSFKYEGIILDFVDIPDENFHNLGSPELYKLS